MAEHAIAVLVDFENMARPGSKSRGDFDIHLVLNRLADKGRVLVKRAYADWGRYREAKHDLQNAGLELIEMPSAREGAKNRADIKLAVDAMELAYSRVHVDNFVIVSGDSDFTPLVGKLRELNKRVTGMGNRESSSELLIANCDEFIFYETLAASTGGRAIVGGAGGRDLDPIELVRQTLTALQREGTEWPLASVVKDSMRRKYPAFDESDFGHSTFSKFLEEVGKSGLLRLETDPRSGTYRVELSDGPSAPREFAVAAAAAEERAEVRENGEGRRRRRRSRRGEPTPVTAEGEEIQDDSEVFEVTVNVTPDDDLGTLPPDDEPISYEHMVMMADEIDPSVIAAAEAAEAASTGAPAAAEEAPPTRGARRRRRRVSEDDEPAVADLVAAEEAEAASAVPDEAPAVEAPVADEPPAEEEKPAPRRRVRRRSTAASAAAEAEAAPVEDPAAPEPAAEAVAAPPAPEAAAEEPPAEEEPKPKPRARRTRKKAEPAVEETPIEAPAEGPAVEAEAPAEEPAPKPKRRTRKKAEPAAEEAPAVAVAEPAAEAPAEEEPKPKPRARRTRKKAEPTPEETPAE